jgi:hypothetical protein
MMVRKCGTSVKNLRILRAAFAEPGPGGAPALLTTDEFATVLLAKGTAEANAFLTQEMFAKSATARAAMNALYFGNTVVLSHLSTFKDPVPYDAAVREEFAAFLGRNPGLEHAEIAVLARKILALR